MWTPRRTLLYAARAAAGAALLLAAASSADAPTASRPSRLVEADIQHGAEMALRGLWREALFRWDRALGDRPGDPRLLNNIAVACEALGQMDRAREMYSRAAELSRDRKIGANYELFQRRVRPADAPESDEP